MPNYTRIRQATEMKLEKAGIQGILRREINDANDDTPWDPTDNEIIDYPITALFDDFNENAIDGTTILFGDRKIWIGGESLVFTKDGGEEAHIVPNALWDKLVFVNNEGQQMEYAIVNVNAIGPGGIDVLYVVQARGAART